MTRKETKETTRSGFKIPDNYFDDFRKNIPSIIEQREAVPKRNKKLFYFAAAASIILIAVSVFTFLPKQSQPKDMQLLALELSDVEYYDIDMDDLYYAYEENSEILNETEIDQENIIDYLESESDLNELIFLSE